MNTEEILNQFLTDDFCRITGILKLTKTDLGFTDAVIFRDRELEARSFDWLKRRIAPSSLMSRYRSYDSSYQSEEIHHFAGRVVRGVGAITSGKNIFLTFPECVPAHNHDDATVFGVELVDIWEQICSTIVIPASNKVFGPSTHTHRLKESLSESIFLASIFHEVGHRAGPFKLNSLSLNHELTQFQKDVLGELATDSLLITNLRELPEIAAFVILQRLFWFGRLGFRSDQVHGHLNTDNDAWIGAYLWNSLRTMNVIERNGDQFKLMIDRAPDAFAKITSEIDLVSISDLDSRAVDQWMRSKVATINGRFMFGHEYRTVLHSLDVLPEYVSFVTQEKQSRILNSKALA